MLFGENNLEGVYRYNLEIWQFGEWGQFRMGGNMEMGNLETWGNLERGNVERG